MDEETLDRIKKIEDRLKKVESQLNYDDTDDGDIETLEAAKCLE